MPGARIDGMTDDLVAFLRARLSEDEAVTRRNLGQRGLGDNGNFPDYRTYTDDDTNAADDYLGRFNPARVLREVEAKRRIIDELVDAREARRKAWANYLAWTDGKPEPFPGGERSDGPDRIIAGLERAVILLASEYADHPDYRQEWKS